MKKVVIDFNQDEAQCIQHLQRFLNVKRIREELPFIKSNLSCISVAISRLEEKSLPLEDSVALVNDVVNKLEQLKNKNFINKLNAVLNNKNIHTDSNFGQND